MRVIDNDYCLVKITEFFIPIEEYFSTEDWEEKLELNIFTDEELKKQFDRKISAINFEKELIQYLSLLDYNYPNKDLMILIVQELYLYLKNYPHYSSNINRFEVVKQFKLFLKNEQVS